MIPAIKRLIGTTRSKAFAYTAIILVAAYAALSPSLQNGFTNWDDDTLIQRNPHIIGLSAANITAIFTLRNIESYYPLPLLSFAAERALFGPSPKAVHAVNLAVHMLNCMAVCILALLLSGSAATAVTCAILFGVHPLNAEAVAWAAGRVILLYAFFSLVTLAAYVRSQKGGPAVWFYLSIVTAILACLCHPAAIVLPLLLLACDYLIKPTVSLQDSEMKAPFIAIAAAYAAALFWLFRPQQAADGTSRSMLDAGLLTVHGIVSSFVKAFVPANLSCYYPPPPTGQLPWEYLLAPAGLLAIAAAAYCLTRRSKTAMFGFLFAATALAAPAVVSQGRSYRADYFCYLPLFGIIYPCAAGIAALWRGGPDRRILRAATVSIVAAAVCAAIVLSRGRCAEWKDSITLWESFFRANGASCTSTTPYINRANAYIDTKRYDEAIADLTAALEIDPDHPGALSNRGNAYFFKGDLTRAHNDYSRSLSIEPNSAKTIYNRGNVRIARRDLTGAIGDYTRATKISPGYAEAHNNLGNAYAESGDPERAETAYRRAIRSRPDFPDPYLNLGNLFSASGRPARAIVNYDRALALKPDWEQALHGRAVAHFLLKEYDLSRRDVERMRSLGYAVKPELIRRLNAAAGETTEVKQ
ncbi:MAG TPA: tetratricopeptide repeat protein [bacterium]|nr:tetratricopeptide repeat protein [bacterium]